MSAYIESLKCEGYISLRDQYLAPQAAFPSLQGGKSGLLEVLDKVDDADQGVMTTMRMKMLSLPVIMLKVFLLLMKNRLLHQW